MTGMIRKLMQEYNLEIDDVRWYLSVLFAGQLLTYKEHPAELADYIQSKRLESDLYEMEENFLRQLAEKLERGQSDESKLREIMAEIRTERVKRFRRQGGSQ